MKNTNEEKHIIFGKGNQKLSSDVYTYSHTPITGCGKHCKTCASTCYALQAYAQHTSVKNKWDYNLKLSKTTKFYREVKNEINRKHIHYVRLFQAGDVYDSKFLNKLYKVIKDTPNTFYWGYTKNPKALKLNELPNCNMIYSFINGYRNYGSLEYCNLLHEKFGVHICSLDESKGEKCGNHCKYCLDKNHDSVCFVIHGNKAKKDVYEKAVIEQLRKM